jgi:uncharacterized lipoprotein YajG
MKYSWIIITAGLLLAGCQTDQQAVITTQYRVVTPPSTYYSCPQNALARVGIRTVADVEKLKDSQVARLINQISKDNKVCAASLRAIKNYIDTAKDTIEGTPKSK